MDTAGALPDPAMQMLEKTVVGSSLNQHFTRIALERVESPLKALWPYMQGDVISLAGGLPHFTTFAFEELSGVIKAPTALEPLSSSSNGQTPESKAVRIPMEVSKSSSQSLTEVQLKDALQYGPAHGLPILGTILTQLTRDLFEPPYEDWHSFLTASSTDSFSKTCQTFLERGDVLIVDEYAYATALATVTPLGVLPRGVEVDKLGMKPDKLRSMLANWDEQSSGLKRPRVLYTVTVGHNPVGVTWSAERKKAIYDICCDFDVLIIEDDPYFYMQFGKYSRPEARSSQEQNAMSLEEWKASLIPSFLKFDTQGRVIRLDTFSKTLAPGLRLGWSTTNAAFAQKIVHANETTTQSPAGFSQAFLAKLFQTWGTDGQLGYDGYYTWCRALGKEYERRRDMIVDALVDNTDLNKDDGLEAQVSPDDLVAIVDPSVQKLVLSFDVPTGGMFLWVRVHLSNHPLASSKSTEELSHEYWKTLADRKVLVAPASMFAVGPAQQSAAKTNGHANGNGATSNGTNSHEGAKDDFFRLAFSIATAEQFKVAAQTIRKTTKEFFARQA